MSEMKMTNTQAFTYMTALEGLEEKGKLGYAIAKNRRKLGNELKEYAQLRDAALKEFGQPTEVPGRYNLTPDAVEKISDALAEIGEVECTADILTVKPDELYKSSLTSKQMFAIDWMIDDE